MAVLKCVDISHHNGNVDYAKLRQGGITCAIIRAGYGLAEDRCFKQNMSKAKASGFLIGVYWFAYPLTPADSRKEAEICLRLTAPYKIDLGIWYDLEYDTERYAQSKGITITKEARTAMIREFCECVAAKGIKTGAYLNPDYMKKINYAELSKYDLWLARWSNADKDGNTTFEKNDPAKVDKSYGKVDIWQIGKTQFGGRDFDINYVYTDAKPPVQPPAQSKPPANPITLRDGDKVKLINTAVVGGKTYAQTYNNTRFRVYHGTYDVIGDPRGDRVVIGIGKNVTAAVNTRDVTKISG
jgi:GH25 family lysozyme M1 (1,4-beta-N-acetylmuramidase)